MKTKFFLDTASLDEIKFWQQFNLVDGVTTNPKLLSIEKKDPYSHLKAICKIVKGPVSAQLTKIDLDEMYRQGLKLSQISKNIIVKVPLIENGVKVAKLLSKKKIKLNITLGFDPAQIIFFKDININYFSFIIGRVEDFGKSNMNNIKELRRIIDKLKKKPKLLSASIRNSDHLIKAINEGSDIITVPPSTWHKILKNEYSISGQNDFLASWFELKKIYKKNKYD